MKTTNYETLVQILRDLLPLCEEHANCAACRFAPKGNYDVCPVCKLQSVIRGMETTEVLRHSSPKAFKRCGNCKHLTFDWPSYLKTCVTDRALEEREKVPVCSIRNEKSKDDMQHEDSLPCKYYERGLPFSGEAWD